jgi:tetratricopeptide (TPR) repeat protein
MKFSFAFVIVWLSFWASKMEGLSQIVATPAQAEILAEAIKAYDRGEMQKTASLLTPLATANSSNEQVYYYLGMVAYDTGEISAAEMNFRKAIALNPKYALPYSELAAIYLNQNKPTEAEIAARQATVLDPSYVSGFSNLGAALLMLHRNDEAYKSFLAAARLDIGSVISQGIQMLNQHDDPAAALYYFNLALDANPDNPMALLNAGQMYRTMGKATEAKNLLKKGYEVTPVTEEPFDVLYSSYFRLLLDTGEYKIIHRDAFTKVGPNYSSGRFFIALAFFKEGKTKLFEEATKTYFRMQKQKLPESITEWARAQIKPDKAGIK